MTEPQPTLFAYGTLQFDEVLRALLGRVPYHEPVDAPGWRAAALERRLYPGLVAAPGVVATGVLLSGLSGREWGILDAYEDDQYELREIALAQGGRCLTYVWEGGDVRDEDWDAELFRARYLSEYAARCGLA
ncbi:gamma-glutamylcyclotransferase [Streptomyces sp. A7024]|uniref:Putative gamma-glutamylcyclotransferase n=1 Tax=Streptomyces coryli TaxID=1128680 RepID=A0A6G4UAU8_9ACTN|nr:gamma-glutamylcyclotransferase family protein [Streptomyces coryli]NGN68840.1 gamma-glutamylcyclotransferase [Streptomyces coryli]